MIIYKKKKNKKLVIPCGLGPVICIDPGYELQTKTVDPSTAEITVEPDASYYGLYHVIVNPVTADIDPDLLASNIKRGVEILGVEGTFDGGPLQDKTVDSSTSGQVITPDGSNYGLGSVTVNPYVLDSKTVNPSTGQITVTSDADGLSSVTVNAAPLQSRTVDPSTEPLDIARTTSNWYGLNHVYINPVTAGIDSDIQAGNIKRGVEILGIEGTFDGGTLQSKTVDASTASQTVTPDAGNYGLSSVTVNPYTVESKSDTITANGQFVYTSTNADALSSVTVDVSIKTAPDLQSKTVDSSTSSQSVTADSNYDGLSSVTVNPYVLDVKTVDSSTVSQTITSSEDGLSSVTVNPYVLDTKTVDPSVNVQTVTSDADGLSSVTVNAAVLQNRTVDPSTVQLDIQRTSNDYYGLRHVYINAVTSAIDPDIQAGNIKRGVEILGVEGTFDGGTLQSKTVNSSTSSQSVTADSGYYGLDAVTVNPYTVEAKSQTITQNGQYTITPANADAISSVDISVNVADIPPVVQTKSETYTQNGDYQVTPDQGYDGISSIDISVNVQPALQSKTVDSSTTIQNVTADSNYDGLSSVTVNPYVLDTKTVDSSTVSQTITSGEDGLSSVTVNPYVLDSKTVDPSTNQIIVNSSADGLSSVTVNAANLQSRTVDPSTVQVRHYPTASGAIGLSSIAVRAVTSSIDSNIQAENIKDGVTILGVTGTFEGGQLQSKTVDSSTVSQTVTPDSSYYGLSSVTVDPYVLDTKTVDCSTGQQVITSDADGLSSVTVNAAKLQGRTVMPQRTDNTIYPNASDGYIGFKQVTIYGVTAAIDPDIKPENIKRDVEILGVTGTFDGGSLQSKNVDSSTVSQTVTPDGSNYGLSSVTVNPYTVESVTVSATTSEQTITPSNADAISSVTVNAATLQNRTVDASTAQIQVSRSSSSYYGLRTVTINAVTSSIDSNIQAENIKDGVTILGVTGTYEGTVIPADYDSIYNALIQI